MSKKFVIPEWVCIEDWDGYVAMRKKIKKPLTERAMKMAVTALTHLRAEGHDPNLCLQQSEFNDHQGLFPPKPEFLVRMGGSGLILVEYLKERRKEGKRPFDENSDVVKYATNTRLPEGFLSLAWREFRRQHIEGVSRKKTVADWAAEYMKALKGNWYKLWWFDAATGEYKLTTQGQQAMIVMEQERQHRKQVP